MLHILIAIIILLSGIFFLFALNLYHIIFRGYAPFVSTRKDVLEVIMENLDLSPDFHGQVYELGCGKAGFLRAMEAKYPKARFLGIEKSLLTFLSASMQSALRGSRIRIKWGDVFRADVRDADVVYCYLNQETMNNLESKLKFECKPLCRIISFVYNLPHFTPEKVIDMDADRKAADKKFLKDEAQKELEARKKGLKYIPKKLKKSKHQIDRVLYFYEI